MKSIRILPIILIMMLIFGACSNNGTKNTSNVAGGSKVKIVTSFYPMYIFTQNITKDIEGVSVVNMAEPKTGCLHDYQMSPADMKTVEDSDIMVINGAGMESFLEKIINEAPDLKIVEASKGLELLKEEEGNDVKHEDDESEHNVNAHIWVSISGAIEEVKNIGEQLAVADPDNAEKYKSNTEEYVKKLEDQKKKMVSALKDIKNRNIVTFHEAFPYFAKEFNLNIVEVIQNESGSEPSAGELADSIKKIKESNVKALFAEPQYSTNTVETVSKETGIKVYELDPVVTGPENPDLDAYVKAMDENLKVLLEALK
ncbi:metal ABC transporter substrate-binding protein [Acetivibrio cellulolyticus]|uniref:metal ABC transporter substrate-binding protein n=1 Tax=Acetivibrio cellulolyticus TaxID=35830 RepID=UPI0001E2FBA9|nr:zinc ABC transporter substrate-binding protein [Acetivibrio cellulolyticus]